MPRQVKDRAQIVHLNAQSWYVEKIAQHFHCHVQTVRQTLYSWRDQGLGGLWETPHPGAQRRWSEADLDYLESCLRKEQRTYNKAC